MARALALLIAIALLAGCDSAESLRVEETRTRLVGTWLREVEAGSTTSRRVVALGADGKFTDRILSSVSGAAVERREFSGEWSYDGTNLKRRYLQENGRQFAGASMRYTTFPLVSVGPTELAVQDNIEGREVSFRRVAEGTQP